MGLGANSPPSPPHSPLRKALQPAVPGHPAGGNACCCHWHSCEQLNLGRHDVLQHVASQQNSFRGVRTWQLPYT